MQLQAKEHARVPPAGIDLWSRVDALVDRTEDIGDLRIHSLQLIAARRWRAQGRPIPDELAEEETSACIVALAVPVLLRRLRAAYAGPMLLMKGPEVAALYPDPTLRPFADVDVLVTARPEAVRALVASGFEERYDETVFGDRFHHSRPLFWPGLPIPLELHSLPNWPLYLTPPPAESLFRTAQPALSGHGLLAPGREEHALLLAAHAWAHAPLASIGDLVDIAAVSEGLDPERLNLLSDAWGVGRLWRTTRRTIDSVLNGGPKSLAERFWARDLRTGRERSVLQSHLENVFSPLWAAPPGKAALAMGAAAIDEIRPAAGETWTAKLGRSRKAIGHLHVRKSHHDRTLEPGEHGRLRSRLLK